MRLDKFFSRMTTDKPKTTSTNEWGWLAKKPSISRVKTIPTYADIRRQSVLDGLEKVKAAEALIDLKNGSWDEKN